MTATLARARAQTEAERFLERGANLARSPRVRLDDVAVPHRSVCRSGAGLARVAGEHAVAQKALMDICDERGMVKGHPIT
jgi:hypothetical protein